jgi:hypothetical protein
MRKVYDAQMDYNCEKQMIKHPCYFWIQHDVHETNTGSVFNGEKNSRHVETYVLLFTGPIREHSLYIMIK